ncbi:uncharacterized protein LOC135808950 [Sycon ciliatum]|uniref:uncharacterized protein LOC135808950 n=1 Tax=Sycon ciliatum TaxID=27933 RepID=UPI0031F69C73
MAITSTFIVICLSVFPAAIVCHRSHGMPGTKPDAGSPWANVCDDGQTGVESDFMMVDESHWTCQGPFMRPKTHLKAVVEDKCYAIEKPKHICVGGNVTYSTNPPLSGGHRPSWPVYGEYKYLPAPRYLHGMEHGAIVMLYNPCASPNDVARLKRIVSGCLRRHLITPYVNLSTPLAVLSWGCILRLNYVDEAAVQAWIQLHALNSGRESGVYADGQYTHELLKVTMVVSDMKDRHLCPGAGKAAGGQIANGKSTVASSTVRTTIKPEPGTATFTLHTTTTTTRHTVSAAVEKSQTATHRASVRTGSPTAAKSTLSPAQNPVTTLVPSSPELQTTTVHVAETEQRTTTREIPTATETERQTRTQGISTATVPEMSQPEHHLHATVQSVELSRQATATSKDVAHHTQTGTITAATGSSTTPRSRVAAAGRVNQMSQSTSSNRPTGASTTAPSSSSVLDSPTSAELSNDTGLVNHCVNHTLHHCLRKIATSKSVWAAVAILFVVLVVTAGLLCMQRQRTASALCCCLRTRYIMANEKVLAYEQRGKHKQPLTQQFRHLSTQINGRSGRNGGANYVKLQQDEEDDDLV